MGDHAAQRARHAPRAPHQLELAAHLRALHDQELVAAEAVGREQAVAVRERWVAMAATYWERIGRMPNATAYDEAVDSFRRDIIIPAGRTALLYVSIITLLRQDIPAYDQHMRALIGSGNPIIPIDPFDFLDEAPSSAPPRHLWVSSGSSGCAQCAV